MDISRVLGHLQDIHDALDDGRDFVAFERRPEMLAAGVKPKAFDGFDFRSKPAVAREIGILISGLRTGGGASLPLTHDLVYRSEPVEAYKANGGTGGQMMLAAFGGPGPSSAGPPKGRGGGYLEPPSRKAIIAQDGAEPRITVAPNRQANGKAPPLEEPGQSQVKAYDDYITEMAGKYRLDPNLIRSIMHLETTHGYYDRLFPSEWRKSILPMNVNTAYWGDRWGSKESLANPRLNIEAGARMLRSIVDKMPKDATVAQIASVYHSDRAPKVDDYGARAQSIHDEESWRKTPWPAGWPLPLGD